MWIHLPGPDLCWTFDLRDTLLPIPRQESLDDGSDPATEELAVRALQARLNSLGFPAGSVDGRLGPRTRTALALFAAQSSEHDPAPEDTEVTNEPAQALDMALLAQVDDMFEAEALG